MIHVCQVPQKVNNLIIRNVNFLVGFDVIQLIDEAKQKESTDKNNATKKQTIIRKRSIDITQTRARKPTPVSRQIL